MTRSFFEKYADARKKKRSVLCVGLDPASPYYKAGTAPEKYFKSESREVDGLFDFSLDVVAAVKSEAVAIKSNLQYVFPFSLAQFRKLNERIHKEGMLSILDIKLNDIGASNDASTYWIAKAGFDAFTFSPFAGNIAECADFAKGRGLGMFVLTLMSNPEAKYFMRGKVEGQTGWAWIAGRVAKSAADGAVVGATQDPEEMAKIRAILGGGKIVLVPGVGAQGGDAEAALKALGENVLMNVGRAILYSGDAGKAAAHYNSEFNRLRGRP